MLCECMVRLSRASGLDCVDQGECSKVYVSCTPQTYETNEGVLRSESGCGIMKVAPIFEF